MDGPFKQTPDFDPLHVLCEAKSQLCQVTLVRNMLFFLNPNHDLFSKVQQQPFHSVNHMFFTCES